MSPTHSHLVESRISLNAAIDFMMCCHEAGSNPHPDRAPCWTSAPGELRRAQLEFDQLLKDPDRVQWETLIRIAAVSATRRQKSTVIVCRRFSPLVTSAAMFTLPAGIDWDRVLTGTMTEPDFSCLSRQASWLNKAPWACLDVRTSPASRPVYGPDFARLVREREVQLIVLDHAPDRRDLLILRRLVQRLNPTLLCPRTSEGNGDRFG